jgi:hypothetical protein
MRDDTIVHVGFGLLIAATITLVVTFYVSNVAVREWELVRPLVFAVAYWTLLGVAFIVSGVLLIRRHGASGDTGT